jgi:hypothetical protein
MPELPKPIKELLEQLGISQESAQRFRFGGIVGKVALVALGGFASVIGVAKYTAGSIQIISVIAILVTTLLIIRWIFTYAEKHPDSATLEGAEVIIWQQQQLLLAAKNMTVPKDSMVVPNPQETPPQASPQQGADE